MRIKSSMTVMITIVTILILSGSPTFADKYVWLGDRNTGWCDELNWDNTTTGVYPDGYPDDANDRATVGAGLINYCVGLCEDTTIGALVIEDDGCVFVTNGYTLTITDAGTHNGRLTIQPPATEWDLRIEANGTVELAGDGASHKIGGEILLTSSTSKLLISGDATLDPFTVPHSSIGGGPGPQYGKVKGQNNSASIAICNGSTLTNNITICGMMTIKSTFCGSTTTGGETVIASKNRAAEKTIRTKNKVADKAKPQKLRTKKTLAVAISTTTSSVICYI